MANWTYSNDALVDTTGQVIIPAVASGEPKRLKLFIQNQDVGSPESFQRPVRIKFDDFDSASPNNGVIMPFMASYSEEGQNCHQGRVTCSSMTGSNVQVSALAGN